MTVVFALPPLRPEVEHMLEAEDLVRRARRRTIDQRVLVPEGAATTDAEITEAIAHLVAARATLKASNAAEAAPSKDL